MATRRKRMNFYEGARALTPFLVAETRFGQFLVPIASGGLGRSVFVDRAYHPDLMALGCAVHMLRRDRRSKWPSSLDMLDTGAGLGLRSVAAVTVHGFEHVVALEPDVELARFVRMNARLNECHNRTRVAPVSVRCGADAPAGHPFETVTLDRLAQRGLFDPSRIGLTWIGGSESIIAALAGAQSLISREVPIVIEVGPQLRDQAERDALVTALEGRYRHATTVGRHPGRVAALDSLKMAEPDGSHLLLTSFG